MSQADVAFARRLPGSSKRRGAGPRPDVDLSASVLACRVHFPEHRYAQDEVTASLTARWNDRPRAASLLRRFHANMGVERRSLALPLAEYDALTGFGQANDAFVRAGTELGARAVESAIGLRKRGASKFVSY